MASDQQIRTTITAGRNSPKSPADFDQGPIMIILLSCLAVAMCFTTLGMGFVNLARGKLAVSAIGQAPIAPAIPAPAPSLKASTPPETSPAISNFGSEDLLMQQQQEADATLERIRQAITSEQSQALENTQQLKGLRTEEAQLSARIATMRSGVSGNAAEERRQLELRSQLERELKDLQQRAAETDLRIEALKKTIGSAQQVAKTNLLVKLGDAMWVECTRAGIVLLPRGDRIELAELQRGSERFGTAVANRRVQFLVRPDGFESFQAARAAAEQHGAASLGYEPLDASWRIKFQGESAQP